MITIFAAPYLNEDGELEYVATNSQFPDLVDFADTREEALRLIQESVETTLSDIAQRA